MKIKAKVLMLMIILGAISHSEEKDVSKTPKYRIPQSYEYIVAIEQGAYEDFLRIVDEENRKKGINSNYSYKATKKERRLYDAVDLVPVAHYTDDHDNYITEFKKQKALIDSEVARNFRSAEEFLKEKIEMDEESQNKMSYVRNGYQKRFYFGNGNVLKDIVFLNKDDFSKEEKKAEKENNLRYLVEGIYKTIGPRNKTPGLAEDEKATNLLGISMEEFYSEIEGKSRTDVAKFLKKKMEEKGIEGVIQKGEELFTLDSKGKEWKVLWTLEPVSLHRTVENDFKETVFTRIYTYTDLKDDSTISSNGKLLYTKDNSIYLQDKLDYNKNNIILSQKKGYQNVEKELKEVIAEAERKANAGENPSNPIERYYADKKNLSQTEFENKWVNPFKNGDFDRDLKNMKAEVDEAKKTKLVVEKEYKEAIAKANAAQQDPDWPKDFISWSWKYKKENEKENYLSTKTEKEKELIKQWAENDRIRDIKYDEIIEIDLNIQQNILKKYGFYKAYWGGEPADEKWLDRVIKDSEIIRNLLGKNIEFRGRGRVEGTIDLGEGDNELTITEQFTGRYGTNIILGPYSKLKNIKVVNVGGQIGNDGSASISGRASLTLDIDPGVKNAEGNLIQHALKDSDPNIVFKSMSSVLNLDNRNKFKIELMTSRIGEDLSIDLGRKVDYKFYDLVKGELDMTIPFISDSIAHELVDNKRFSKAGTSLLDVKIKDEIKRLDSHENEVYKSIKNAKKIGVLSETLTTTNKKTTFSIKDDEREEKKIHDLAVYLKTKSGKELLHDLSQFNLSETEKNEMLELISKIKNSKTVENIMKKENDLKTKLPKLQELEKLEDYKKLNLSQLYKDLDAFKINDLRDERENKKVRDENTKNIKDILAKVDMAVLTKLKDEYPEFNLKEVLSGINNVNSQNVEDKWDFGFLLNRLETLKEQLVKQLDINSEKMSKELSGIDKELSDNLEKYSSDSADSYRKLKGKIYYTLREEEVLSELRNLLGQLNERNIYSKLNKISKNEISTYTNIPFDISHELTDKKHIARGGFISNRTVQKNFKGNIYTGYGLYETTSNSGTKYGFLFGGANTDHNEVYKRTLTTVATESEIKGVSAYAGSYFNKNIVNNLNWISGVGVQYGKYKVKRDMKNNYQRLSSTGKVNTTSLNTYTGVVINYPIHEDVYIQLKGLMSYTMVKQGKFKESGDLALDVNEKTYHYVDGEAGISFNKIFYGDDLRSSISAGAYGILGLSGYKNDELKARVNGSSTSFDIKGDRVKKDAVKINLDYNVQTDEGYNYGLEGTYISNSQENNVKIGIKAGYVF